MEAGDPFSIIRRFWAANNILQNPDDLRVWETLPLDVMEHVMEAMDKRNLASMRMVCKAWNTCVNSSVSSLQLCLASLPKLQDLGLTHAGPGSLENIDVLTGLTSLAVIRPNDGTFANRSSTAEGDEQDGNVNADADADAAAAAGGAGAVPNWVLPGGGYAALAAAALLQLRPLRPQQKQQETRPC
ncbi:hypothetical protein COO60DRAFT_1638060 [Scenedesmus sp. NREL 46B-D3]|nr:hypothetical protein COO60DRAFT_1638060 [Scenedesmus sp. NREL 46B-D3]